MPDAMLYAGRLNSIAGEPGGGKTWVALHACAEAIKAGIHVLYLDLEDHPDSVVGRLRALGCTDDEILGCFHYVNPTGPYTDRSADYTERKIAALDIQLVVIDSIGELLSLQGVNPNDDDKVAAIYRAIPRRLAKLGPAVLLLDHVPKNNEATPLFAIGSQRKKAAIDGASYMCETVKAFAAGVPGKIVLRTAKDRSGNFVTGAVAAEINIDSADGGDRLTLEVRSPERGADGVHVRQTVNMDRISRFLQDRADVSANRSEIERGSGVRNNYVSDVLADLVTEGWIAKYPGGKGKADRYCLLHPFDEHKTPPSRSGLVAAEPGLDPEYF